MADLVALAKEKATKYGLDPALVCAMCEHESGGWNTWAIRVEPRYYEKYCKPLNFSDTEEYSRAISWGLMQVMGGTARELGYKGRYLSQLCVPDVGIEYGCLKLKECMDKVGGDTRKALLRYNGGGNLEYPDLVLRHVEKYR